jgi:hypothetical protein
MPIMEERKMPMCEEMRDGCLRGCTSAVFGVASAAREASVGIRGSEDSRDRIISCESEPSSSVRLYRLDPRLLGSSDSDLRARTCGSMYMSNWTKVGDSRFRWLYASHGIEK